MFIGRDVKFNLGYLLVLYILIHNNERLCLWVQNDQDDGGCISLSIRLNPGTDSLRTFRIFRPLVKGRSFHGFVQSKTCSIR